MATEIKIPIPDQTTEEVRIVKWRKAPNEAVAKGDIVLEVETDKSVIEVEAVGDGVLLKQLFAENDTVPVGQTVAFVGAAGEAVPDTVGTAPTATTAPAAGAATAVHAAPQIADTDERVKASPVARKIAAKLGVELTQVIGSGPKGRIVRADVEGASQQGQTVIARGEGSRLLVSPNARRIAKELGVNINSIAGTGPNGRIIGDDVKQYAASATAESTQTVSMSPAPGQPQPGTEVAVTKLRRAIGKNLQMSFRDTPHFNTIMAIDMTRATAFRKQINAGREKPQRISVNDLVLKACAIALRQWPAVNSRFTEEKITYLPDVNIGVATAIDSGLVVPVLTNADQKSWDDIAAETKRLAAEARNGKILGAGKGTFTVSNLGMFGVEQFTAIINPPESAILAVGGVQDEVVAINGMIAIRPMMRVTLCSDHRVIDGALAAQFLQTVKRYLEEQIA